eukprot:5833046-Alexandrium_andersonii.AAC.1
MERGPQAYAGLLPPMPPFVDPNAVQPYPVLDPVREAQPHGPLRPPAPSEPAVPDHSRAPRAG